MRRAFCSLAGLLLIAAGPVTSFDTATPMPDFRPPPRPAARVTVPSGYSQAPTPNQDAAVPSRGKASRSASVAPGLFTRADQYRGEGLSAASSSQAEQERRVKPGAGIKLSMPLQ